MEKRLLLFFGLFLMQSVYHIHCAEQLQSKPLVEDCMDIVVQKTRFPNRASQLVAGYLGYRVKKTLPAQESVCVEHVMPDGSLVCVTRDGLITVRNLKTNELLTSTQFPREHRERWSVTRTLSSIDNNHVVIPCDDVHNSNVCKTVVLDIPNEIFFGSTINFEKKEYNIDSVIVPLPENKLLITYRRGNPALIFCVVQKRQLRAIKVPGYEDIILLPDNRLAAAHNGTVMFSSLDAPFEMLADHDLLVVPHYDEPGKFNGGVQSVDKLLALPNGKLAVASSFSHSSDAWLSIFDTKTCEELSRFRFEGEKKISPVLLADGDIAVKKEQSAEVDILYAHGGREALALGKRVVDIQGLTNGDLFVKNLGGEKYVVTKKFDQAIYLQKQRALQQKQMETARALTSKGRIPIGHASEDVALPEFCGS